MTSLLQEKFPHILFFIYLIYFGLLAIDPFHRGYWLAANTPSVLLVLFFVLGFRRFRFSNTAYLLAAFFVFFQTLGAHYFFSRVPFDMVTQTFGFTRHNFDRLTHVTVGFYAFPIAQYLRKKQVVTKPWALYVFSFAAVMAAAGVFEIMEWVYVTLVSPGADADFLGAQGDIWDAQKDMLADGAGAVMILLLYYFCARSVRRKKA